MKDIILKYTLQNAIRYNGKANAGAIISKVLGEDHTLKKNIKEIAKKINIMVKEINSLSLEEQKLRLKDIAPKLLEKKEAPKEKILPDLPNAKGKIIMRLAPYPSGPLHIGNARAMIINDYYIQRYKGKLLLIIDDTIGSKEKDISKEAYKLIPKGLEWLGIKFDKKIIYKSDRLKIYYKYAEEIIKKDLAYICKCDSEMLRGNRAKGIACACRNKSRQENLKEWKQMFKAKEGSMSLRIKTSMQDKNPAFRDRVLFRISDRKHPRVGKKYRVWPLLDFSWAIDDHLLGITHIIRGKELMIESQMEKFIWNAFGWKKPVMIHTGLIHLEGVKLSKSKSKKEVISGKYKGWDDPRTWSLQSLERRGIYPEALRKFCLNFGLNQNEISAPVDNLYAEDRKIIEPRAKRYFFVSNPKKIVIKDTLKMKAEAPLHPDYPKMGKRIIKNTDKFYISDKIEKGKVYRFMHLFNFKNNKFLSEDYDSKLNAKMIHWLPVSKELVKVEVIMDDGSDVKGLGEKDLRKVKVNQVIQFERFAFVRCDKKTKDKMIFYFSHK